MSNLTNYAENKVVDALLRGQAIGTPATWYFALASAVADAEAGSFTELTGTGYARVGVTASMANFAGTQSAGSTTASSGSGGQTSNNAAITFGSPGASWGTATHLVLCDASSGGNAWIIKSLLDPKNINLGDPAPTFPAGAFTFTVA